MRQTKRAKPVKGLYETDSAAKTYHFSETKSLSSNMIKETGADREVVVVRCAFSISRTCVSLTKRNRRESAHGMDAIVSNWYSTIFHC